MTQALAPHPGQSDFDAALIADDPAMLHALVLSAQALPIGDGPENARAEQTVTFGLKGPVVDGLGLSDFPVRPAPDLLGRGSDMRIESKSAIRFARS